MISEELPRKRIPHDRSRRHELVGHDAVDPTFKEVEEREPDSGTLRVHLHEGAVVSERVVVQEQASRNIERDENVDRIMLVSRQNEEDSEQVDHPRKRVQVVITPRRILRDEEIEQCEYCRVARKHVVSTRSDTLYKQSTSLKS